MRTSLRLLTCALGFGLGLLSVARADECLPPVGDDSINEHVLLRVADYAEPGMALALLEARWPGIAVIGEIPAVQTYLLLVPPGAIACEVVTELLKDLVNPNPDEPDPSRPLAWAELNYNSETGEGKSGTIFINTFPGAGQPTYGDQYVHGMLGLNTAHQQVSGAGMIVAVLDTGIDATHQELAGRVLPGFNFVNDSINTADVGDGLNSDPNSDELIDEMVGHGTFVAGLVALTAPGAMLLPVVVLDSDGIGDAFEVAEGIHYAVDRGADVINMSLGSTYKAEVIEDAVDRAEDLGIPVFAAAGNQNREEPEEYPAMYSGGGGGRRPGENGVAAVNEVGIRAPFSNFSQSLFLAAPGTTFRTGGGGFDPERALFSLTPGDAYAVWDGSSFATAFVSGAAALVRAQHPEWPHTDIGHGLLIEALTDGAQDIDALNPGHSGKLGVGLLDVAATVALGPLPPTPGDLDADGDVDLADLSQMLSDYSKSISSADLNGNGVVDIGDVAQLLANFGT